MAQRIIKKIEIGVGILVLIIFIIIANKYLDFPSIVRKIGSFSVNSVNSFKKDKTVCGPEQVRITVSDGILCRDKAPETIYTKIYDTYPKHPNGREIVYNFLDEGDIVTADKYLKNEIVIDRYEPVTIDDITWEENPYDGKYWGFVFYSLRETRHLLYAYRQTGKIEYRNKLEEMVISFIDNGDGKSKTWDDYHAVAFRAMVLTNTWWKLREVNTLSPELNEKLLKSIKQHADFLVDKKHYQQYYNHGINQSIALLLISVSFPELDEGGVWRQVALKRFDEGAGTLIDDDGVLVENSPFYHFYVFEKYWQISKFFSNNNLKLNEIFRDKFDKMASYATYILQPNLENPLMGASPKRQIGNSGTFKEITAKYPEFLYVLTQGKEGVMPSELNKYYPVSGQVILRSNWGSKTKFDNNFINQTQVIIDAGPYRTNHSDLDALGFNLYSNGKTLITDTGLFSYDPKNSLTPYFRGTAGHNTILVDGKNQQPGSPTASELKQGNGYSFYSAQHSLYPKTYHQRGMALIGHDVMVIIDRLISDREHDYEQIFHLFPSAKTKIIGDTLVVSDDNGEKFSIKQFLIGSETTVKDGLCSFEYEKTVSCPVVTYKQHSKNAVFITVIKIGGQDKNFYAELESDTEIKIKTADGEYIMNLNQSDVNFFEDYKVKQIVNKEFLLDIVSRGGKWNLEGDDSDRFILSVGKDGGLAITPKLLDEGQGNVYSYKAQIEGVDNYYPINKTINIDIPADITKKKFKIYEQEDFLPILGYHQIIADSQVIKSPTLEITSTKFDEQINYLTNTMGCRWFTFGDIMANYVLKGLKTPKSACVITFDDGRANAYANGYPILKKYGSVASFYIITDMSINKKGNYMGVEEINTLYKNGNEIGSHTVSHNSLTESGYGIKEIKEQIEVSKKILEDEGYDITTFAYPKGDQNQLVVDLAKKSYLSGRDTLKDDSWRDRRSSTVSFDKDFVWHMNYFKTELEKTDSLESRVGYNTWWQFEEGYRADINSGRVRVLSSCHPTVNSYSVVELPEVGDKISNKFIVSKDSPYIIEVYGTVNVSGVKEYSASSTMDVYIDGIKHKAEPYAGSTGCVVHEKQYYCFYNVSANLKAGQHVISVEAKQRSVKLDKFRMYRSLSLQDSYSVKITEEKTIESKDAPIPIVVDIKKSGLFNINFSDYINKIIHIFN